MHLLEPLKLPGPAAKRRTVAEEERRVVAHLLESEDRAEDLAAIRLVVVLALDVRKQLVDDRLVERCLLASQVARLRELDLVGQLRRDRPIGLDPAEDERRRDAAEPLGRVIVTPAFDRDREAAVEVLLRAQEPGVREVHDRPELAEPVFDRCSGRGQIARVPAGCALHGSGQCRSS